MNFICDTNNEPQTFKVVVKTAKPQRIRIKVYDPNNPNTVYTYRTKDIRGEEAFFVRLPLSPKKCAISVYNELNGNLKKGHDKTFDIVSKQRIPLQRRLECFKGISKTDWSAIKFIEQFSERAGYLSAGGSVYFSDDGKYRIDYLDVIKDVNGRELRTPARISQSKGIIEVSRKHFIQYTVPMRIAILLHEWAHFYKNARPTDEIEADLNGLLVYLALGYPRIEAHLAFIQVFKNSPSDLNVNRHKILSKFIDEFESYNFKCVTPSEVYNGARK